MAYVKNIWVDQDVERPKTYEVTNNQDGSITLTDSFGLVTELGTPVNATNMNHIEDGLADTDLTKYNATTTYNAGEWVTGVVDNEKGIYASKVNNNTGNALSNDTYWEKVELGGGTRNIGEIVASTIPLTDAGLHLLDGALLQYGSYQAFIDYIAELYDSGDYDDIFETEANWQTAVTTYGVCGKFVYDSVNNTVRLPKYNSKIYTGGGNAPVVGNGCLGVSAWTGSTESAISTTSRMVGSEYSGDRGILFQQTTNSLLGVVSDGAKSGIIADLSNITTSLDGYYYIVIATSTKTDIQVDIDEIATDLNGKADVDLTNTSPAQTFISSMFNATSPDWSAGISKSSSGFTADEDGWIRVYGASYNSHPCEISINGTALMLNQSNLYSGSYWVQVWLTFPVHNGDVIVATQTGVNGLTFTFYPLKGAN